MNMDKLELLQQLGSLLQGNEQIAQITAQVAAVLSVIGLILALLQCFFGYKMLRFWVTLIGFLIGFALGAAIMAATGEERAAALVIAVGIVSGILISVLSFKLYLVSVFLYCGLLAAVAVSQIRFPEAAPWQTAGMVLMVIAFIAAGVLAVKFQRYFVIGVTSIAGGLSASRALSGLVPELAQDARMAAAAAVIMIVLGAAVQLMTTRNRERRRRGR